jgi:hypothetical protein
MNYELYAVQVELNGTGFPLGYLFLETGNQNGNGSRSLVITKFLKLLNDRGLNPEFFLSDKDFAQISAIRTVWPLTKIQLCRWHIKRAVELRLSSNKLPQKITYDGTLANKEFPNFVNINFVPTKESFNNYNFCPREYRKIVWSLMDKHLHQHPLIPTIDGQFLSSKIIREKAVFEVYQFCENNSLVWLWSYLWREWYCPERWTLWARSSCDNKLSILKTTMIVEGHWKTIKRDFLYKFFRPRLDFVIYILVTKVVKLQQRKFYQIIIGREQPEWKKNFKAEWKRIGKLKINNDYLTDENKWICSCSAFLTNRFFICKHLIQKKGEMIAECFKTIKRNNVYPFLIIQYSPTSIQETPIRAKDIDHSYTFMSDHVNDDSNDGDVIFDRLILLTEDTKKVLEEQRKVKNIKWAKSIEKNFKSLDTMIKEISTFRNRKTTPLTTKDHTHNTRYLK